MIFIIIGWIGTCIYLINHCYISINKNWKHGLYYGGNFIAALALVLSSVVIQSWQAVIINSFWAVLSLLLYFHVSLNFIPLRLKHFYLSLLLFAVAIIYSSINLGSIDIALLGWLSAFIFSIAYLLFCLKLLLPRYYLLFNALAAIILLPQLWLDNNMPVFTLEVVWAIISIFGAVKRYSELRLIDYSHD